MPIIEQENNINRKNYNTYMAPIIDAFRQTPNNLHDRCSWL